MDQGVANLSNSGELGEPSQHSDSKSVSPARAAIVLIIGVVALAFTAPWVKQANFEPATSVILRVGIALLAIGPFAFVERSKLGGLNKKGILLSLAAGLFLGVDFTAWNYSIFFVGSGIASVLLNLQIIILPMLAVMFDGLKIPKSFFVLAPIMIFGVVLTGGVLDSAPSEGPLTAYGMNIALLGTLLGALSGVCYGIYLYSSREATMMNPGRIIQPIALTCVAQLVAPTLWILLFSNRGFDVTNGVLVDGKLPMNPETTLGDPITAMNWFWIVVLAIVGQAIAWTFVQYGSVRMNPTVVSGLLLLSPVLTVAVIAPILFAEVPSVLQVVGVVIVLGAVAYQNGLHRIIFKGKSDGPGAPASTT